ncbi:MAG: sigma-70 family RNA polymerase sigma factor [Acidobacteria bacterium]|nr:sigma-70 family RNA polymerase sigma factor [Acidobacteriota bacterium]
MTDELDGLVDHLFRRSAGQMVATLARVFGPEYLSLAEEVVQEALVTALQQWRYGVPDDPAAWLFRVARNRALDHLRRQKRFVAGEQEVAAPDPDDPSFAHELRDDALRMMLMCCHPALPEESRIALTLKTVGGFSVDEIARAFLSHTPTIAQRLVRAKRLIRERAIALELPARDALPPRLESLFKVLYLIFNEGYNAHEGEALVRTDLCAEAVRLATEVAMHPVAGSPSAHALLALMLLQSARLPARINASGELTTLMEQDRSLWDQQQILEGMRQLDASASGTKLTRYHVEAAIAAEHCIAPTFEATNWRQIVSLYDDLLHIEPSPVVALNRAVAVAMAYGEDAGIEAIAPLVPALGSYLPLETTLGELHRRRGDFINAAKHFTRALELPCTMPEKRFLLRKLEATRSGR